MSSSSEWHSVDPRWASYWSNGPEQVAAALVTPPIPVFECRTLNDMNSKEIAAIELQYNCKVLKRDTVPGCSAEGEQNENGTEADAA